MGSLFIVAIPVRSYEFQLRLSENRLLATLSVQTNVANDAYGALENSLEPENALLGLPKYEPTREIILPKAKEDNKTYTLFRDGQKLYLDITRDTMKLEQVEYAKPLQRRGSTIRKSSSGGSLSLYESGSERNPRNRRDSYTAIHETDLHEVINSHFLEKHMEEALTKFSLLNAAWDHSIDEKFSQVCFTVKSERTETIINHLQSVGIGKKYESTLSVCTATVFSFDEGKPESEVETDDESVIAEKEKAKGKWNDFVQSIKARLTVAQVVQNVKANAIITFDFIVMVLVAGIIAGLGLLENSSVNLVASMLISPLMGPIMAFTFGAMIRDWSLIKTGIVAEILGLSMCLVIGLIIGIFAQSKPLRGPWYNVDQWPTSEMTGRSKLRALVVGAGIAIPSGAGVALSILAGNAGSLVGVAISASLLPPAVNCGVFYGLTLVIAIRETIRGHHPWDVPCDDHLVYGHPLDPAIDHWRNHDKVYCLNSLKEFAIMGTVSLCLTLLNIVLIFFTSIIVLKIKEVAPYTTKNSFERFWKHDLKEARDYNKAHSSHPGGDTILDDVDDTNVPKLLNAVEDDFVFNQIKNRVMYRDENVIRQVKERKSKQAIAAAAVPSAHATGSGYFGWFGKSTPAHDVEADKGKTQGK